MLETTKVIKDFMGMKESFGPKGLVKIDIYDKYLPKRTIIKSNLILNTGRKVALQRVHNADSGGSLGKNQFISWCGVGSGGVIGGELQSPTEIDTGLATPVDIYTTPGPAPSTYYVDAVSPDTYNLKTAIPEIILGDIVSKNLIVIDFTDCYDNVEINEAVLFTSDSADGTSVTELTAFSRVCFPTILKTTSRKLTFEWYIYF